MCELYVLLLYLLCFLLYKILLYVLLGVLYAKLLSVLLYKLASNNVINTEQVLNILYVL
jgi:hypothetical protein